jgi:AraC-like DNA-binding protein
LGIGFQKPSQIDSVPIKIENIQGDHFWFSNFKGSEKSYNQGKLVSKSFIINRRYISLLIGGGKHDTRECVNLIIDNKIVRSATGSNNHQLSTVTWNVGDLQGENAIIEIVDAMSPNFDHQSLPYIIVDNIVFSDNKYPKGELFEDFESGSYDHWKVEGEAFEVPRNRVNVYYPISVNGFNGNYFAFSFGETQDSKQGKLISREFEIEYENIKLLVGGGNHKKMTCVNLIVNDSIVHSEVGENDGQMRWHDWDVSSYIGNKGRIEIVDHYSGNWGHIMVDDIIFYNKPKQYSLLYLLGIVVITLASTYFIGKRLNFKGKTKPKIAVSEEDMEKFRKIKLSIENSKIYKLHNPSIKSIVKDSGVEEDEINFLFENIENSTLTNFINYLRVEEFKRQLKDPANAAYTMIHIAEKSGFNSKTSFYRAFKSITKITPSQYRRNLESKH